MFVDRLHLTLLIVLQRLFRWALPWQRVEAAKLCQLHVSSQFPQRRIQRVMPERDACDQGLEQGSDSRCGRVRVETPVVRQFLGTAGARESRPSAVVPACHRFPRRKDVDSFQAYEDLWKCLDVLNIMALNDLKKLSEYKP